ncbi:hypothetical protein BDR05DRAFT_799495 [Suillus weaverae]|nr:hypothetical protein BDR05DRAFT_799495 [Suillus weaverae]
MRCYYGNWSATWRPATFLSAGQTTLERRNGLSADILSQMMIISETPDRPAMWTRLSLPKGISCRHENYGYAELHSLTLDSKPERCNMPVKNAYYRGGQLPASIFGVSLPANISWNCDEDFKCYIVLASIFTVAALAKKTFTPPYQNFAV